MRRWPLLLAFCVGFSACVNLNQQNIPGDSVVWAGLDYARVQMVGTQDFRQPDNIFPAMLDNWNYLFLEEMIPNLEEALGKSVIIDVDGMRERNRLAKKDQIIRRDGSREEYVDQPHITDKELAKAVASYELKQRDGIALCFVVERLVKLQGVACLHIVFFDIASRDILMQERVCPEAGGFGFRNYWFGPIKEAVDLIEVTPQKWGGRS